MIKVLDFFPKFICGIFWNDISTDNRYCNGYYLCTTTFRPHTEYSKTNHLAKFFNSTFRYIVNVLSLNKQHFNKRSHRIYPVEHEIKDGHYRKQYVYSISFPRYRYGWTTSTWNLCLRHVFKIPIINIPFLSIEIDILCSI